MLTSLTGIPSPERCVRSKNDQRTEERRRRRQARQLEVFELQEDPWHAGRTTAVEQTKTQGEL